LGEILTPAQLLGGAVMLVGIVVAQQARQQKAHEPLPEYEAAT
jgi:drug/metabolite transporter (DMT)-like permease